ncbi:hypothetical protein PUV54_13415 [Hyphococcus flavus]|uniref:Hda lid domain-containing protein n=1 Tax=Hyphococcus flavus TaxID=1866326 RepID=A0AAE9ZAV9_9PROT|nr:hypothetical protein [Hyphococcus flavus]WDI30953.1 hypothetical protein PUV54_13415 [Hyphococcus flavus]
MVNSIKASAAAPAAANTKSLTTDDTRQLPLDLPENPPYFDRSSFLRSDSNETAWQTGNAWLRSDETLLLVCGPEGSGKSHFSHAILDGQDFVVTSAIDFTQDRMAKHAFLVIDEMPSADPRSFLARLETVQTTGVRLILAGQGHPSEWALGLKDLRTRLEAAPRAILAEPDEFLIRAVITKGFRDRQVAVSPQVIEYAAPRLPRTFAAAHTFVRLADRQALEQKRKITTPFVQKLLNNLSEGLHPA